MTTHGVLKAYFQLDSGNFEYWFNGLKIDDIDQIKAGFREVFNQPGFYNSILDSNMLNAYLISKNIDTQADFLIAVNKIPYGPLYDFVKIVN